MAINNKSTNCSKNNDISNLKKQGSESKTSGGRKVERPAVLESKYNRVELAKQSMSLANSKKGKTDLSQLPIAIQESVKNKERIESITKLNNLNSPEEIRKKLSIEAKPLTRKRAEELREERTAFFAANIKKTQKSESKVPLVEKKAKISSNSKKDVKISKTSKSTTTAKKVKKK